jgi:D-lactate dehydrogenase
MIQIYQDNPEYFKLNPEGKTLGLNKKLMLEHLDKKRAKYPAEHNVGHLYEAEDVLKNFYQEIDPTNTFNPGIGKMSKNKNYQ